MPCAAILLVSGVETDVVSIAVEKWLSGSRSARSAIGRLPTDSRGHVASTFDVGHPYRYVSGFLDFFKAFITCRKRASAYSTTTESACLNTLKVTS